MRDLSGKNKEQKTLREEEASRGKTLAYRAMGAARSFRTVYQRDDVGGHGVDHHSMAESRSSELGTLS